MTPRFVIVFLSSLLVLPTISRVQEGAVPSQGQQISSYDDLVSKARALAAQKNFKDAVTVSEQGIQMDDKRWEAYVVAAEAYSGQQFYDDAIGMLQMALIRAPQDKKPLLRDAIGETRKMLTASAALSNPPLRVVPQPPAGAAPSTQAEIVLWKSIENSKSVSDYQAYLKTYPNGTYAPLAEQRISSLSEKTPDFVIKKQTDWLRDPANIPNATYAVSNCSVSSRTRKHACEDSRVSQKVLYANGCTVGMTGRFSQITDFRLVDSAKIAEEEGQGGYFVNGYTKNDVVTDTAKGTFTLWFASHDKADEALQRMVELTRACQGLTR